jgi:hypothetical protein
MAKRDLSGPDLVAHLARERRRWEEEARRLADLACADGDADPCELLRGIAVIETEAATLESSLTPTTQEYLFDVRAVAQHRSVRHARRRFWGVVWERVNLLLIGLGILGLAYLLGVLWGGTRQ